MENKPFSPEEYADIYSRVPRLAIEVVIQTSDGVILLLRRNYGWEGQWHLPGMTMLYGETVGDAISRIAKEEVGVKVSVEKLLGYIEYPSEQKERGFGRTIGLAFLCSVISGELQANNDASGIRAFKDAPSNIIEEQRVFLRAHLLMGK